MWDGVLVYAGGRYDNAIIARGKWLWWGQGPRISGGLSYGSSQKKEPNLQCNYDSAATEQDAENHPVKAVQSFGGEAYATHKVI